MDLFPLKKVQVMSRGQVEGTFLMVGMHLTTLLNFRNLDWLIVFDLSNGNRKNNIFLDSAMLLKTTRFPLRLICLISMKRLRIEECLEHHTMKRPLMMNTIPGELMEAST